MRREWACPRRSSVDALFTVKWLTAATLQAAITVSAIRRAHGLVGGEGWGKRCSSAMTGRRRCTYPFWLWSAVAIIFPAALRPCALDLYPFSPTAKTGRLTRAASPQTNNLL